MSVAKLRLAKSKREVRLQIVGETVVGKGYKCKEFYDCTVCYRPGSRARHAEVLFLNGSDASLIASYSVRPQHKRLVLGVVG